MARELHEQFVFFQGFYFIIKRTLHLYSLIPTHPHGIMFRVADDGSVSFEPTSSSSTASGRTPPDALSSNQPSPSLVGWAVRADGSVFVVEPGGRERDVSLNLADIPFTVGDDHGLAAGAADDDAASLASTVASSASQIDGMVSRGFEKALAMICFDVGWIDDGSTSVTSISKAMAAGGSAVFGPATDEIVRRCIDYAAIVDCFDEACASSGGAKRRRQSTPNAQSSASSGAAATPASAVTTPAPAGLLTRAKKVLHDAAASLTSSAAPAPSPTERRAEP